MALSSKAKKTARLVEPAFTRALAGSAHNTRQATQTRRHDKHAAGNGTPDTAKGQPMTQRNDIDSEWIALARAVIIQAAREAVAGDESAAAWLAADETAETWLFVAGVRRSAVVAWLDRRILRPGTRKGTARRSRSTTSAKITSANKRAAAI